MRSAIAAALIALLALTTGALAQEKFPNKDTAQDRQDYSWGTHGSAGTSGTASEDGAEDGTADKTDGETWGHTPTEPEPERDWYDEVIITVNPDVDYGSGSTTTTSTDYTAANATQATNSTSTTTTTTAPNP